MREWLNDFFKFVIRTPAHPIYQRERVGWAYVKVWRQMNRGCVPLIVLLLAATTCFCSGITTLILLPDQVIATAWPFILIAGLFGLYFGEAILNFIIGLLATMLGSTVISSEIEAQTFSLLRLTPISAREIVLAKFGAVMRQIRTPMLIGIAVRFLLILIGGGAILLFIASGALQTMVEEMALEASDLLPYGIAAAMVVLALLLASVSYLVRPIFTMLLFASLGVFSSSLAKTRSSGLLTAGGFRLVLAMVTYVLGQIVSSAVSVLMIPVFMMSDAPSPDAIVGFSALTAILSLLLVMAFELGTALALLMITTRRANNLPALG